MPCEEHVRSMRGTCEEHARSIIGKSCEEHVQELEHVVSFEDWKSCEVHVLEIVHVAHVRNWNTEEHVEEHISKQGGKIY